MRWALRDEDVRLDGFYLGAESWCVSTLMHLDDWLYESFWAVSCVSYTRDVRATLDNMGNEKGKVGSIKPCFNVAFTLRFS